MASKEIKIPITAADRFSSTFGKLNQAIAGSAAGAGRLNRVFSSFRSLGNIGGLGGLLGGGLSIAGIASLTKGVADYGDNIAKFSRLTGMSVDEMQRLVFAAKMLDIEQVDLNQSMFRFAQVVAKSTVAGGEQAKMFAALGVKTKDASGKVRPLQDVLLDSADAFKKIQSPALRAQVLMGLFGRAGAKMGELLLKGSDGIKEIMATMVGGMTDGEVAAAEKMDEQIKILGAQFDGFKRKIGGALLPGVGKIMETLGQLMDKNSEKISRLFSRLGDALPGALSRIGKAFRTLYPVAKLMFTQFMKIVDVLGPGNVALIALGGILALKVIPPMIQLAGVMKTLTLFTVANPFTLAIIGLGAALAVTGTHFYNLISYANKWKNFTGAGKVTTAQQSKKETVASLNDLYNADIKATGGNPTFDSPAIKDLEGKLTASGMALPTDLVERQKYISGLNSNLSPTMSLSGKSLTGGLAPQKAEITLKIVSKEKVEVQGITGDANIAGVNFDDIDMGRSLITE
jgi:hypothetical protein